MVRWNFDNLIKARKVLNDLWEGSLLKGRCWGPNKDNNPFIFSNITIATEIGGRIELVSISQKEDGILRIHEFIKTNGTGLGFAVRGCFEKAGLKFEPDTAEFTGSFPAIRQPYQRPKRKPSKFPYSGVRDGTNGYPLCWGVLAVLTKRSDEEVMLSEIIGNPWLIKTCYGLGKFMNLKPPDVKQAENAVKEAVAHLRRRGYEIESVKKNDRVIGYLTGETDVGGAVTPFSPFEYEPS